jgi:ABC-type dipeptide/oligopeptide/nickel transport system permease component
MWQKVSTALHERCEVNECPARALSRRAGSVREPRFRGEGCRVHAQIQIRRLALAALIVFLALWSCTPSPILPSSYVENIARNAPPARGRKHTSGFAQVNQVYGLDQGHPAGFFTGWATPSRCEFVESCAYKLPFTTNYERHLVRVAVNTITFQLEIAVCIPLGCLAARKQYSKDRQLCDGFS